MRLVEYIDKEKYENQIYDELIKHGIDCKKYYKKWDCKYSIKMRYRKYNLPVNFKINLLIPDIEDDQLYFNHEMFVNKFRIENMTTGYERVRDDKKRPKVLVQKLVDYYNDYDYKEFEKKLLFHLNIVSGRYDVENRDIDSLIKYILDDEWVY